MVYPQGLRNKGLKVGSSGGIVTFWFEFLCKARECVCVLRQAVISDAGCGQDRTGTARMVYKFWFLSGKRSRSKLHLQVGASRGQRWPGSLDCRENQATRRPVGASAPSQ
jgi:hypothetical protein